MESKIERQVSREKVLAVSIDFDGCLGSQIFAKRYQELLGRYGAPEKILPKEYEKAIVETNQVLFDYILKMSVGFDRVIIMVGSNRTSAKKDQHDGIANGNGSVFLAIKHLANALNRSIKCPVEINKRVMFDSVLAQKPGHNFDLKTNQEIEENLYNQYGMSGDSKYRLSYFQIQDICASNPNSDVVYVHADDRDDIVATSAGTYAKTEMGSMLPSNLKNASFLHYEQYNPIAQLIRLQSTMSKIVQSNAKMDDFPLKNMKAEVKSAIEVIVQDMKMLVALTGSEFGEENESKQKLDSATLNEIEKAREIIKNLSPVLTLLDKVETIEELDTLTFKINNVMRSNVRSKNMTLPAEISREYELTQSTLYPQRITEFGKFEEGSPRIGYTIPSSVYDSLVIRCFKDDYSNTSNPLSILQSIKRDSQSLEFGVLVHKLKNDLKVNKLSGDKWSNMIVDDYQQITPNNSAKERALIKLSNVIFTLKGNISSGELSYKDAVPMLKEAVEYAIKTSEDTQKNTFFGRMGVTQSDVARQLKVFMEELPQSSDTFDQEYRGNITKSAASGPSGGGVKL